MTRKANNKKLSLLEIYGSGPHMMGNPSFGGDYFGFGGQKQLIVQDKQVAKIKSQEELEHNTNAEDQNWILGKGTLEKNLNERSAADLNYSHLPGNLGAGALENQENHLPSSDLPYDSDKYLGGHEVMIHSNYPPADNTPLGGAGQIIAPKQFVPNNIDDINETKNKQTNIQKNIKTIKKYLNLLKSTKPNNDQRNYITKIDNELKSLGNQELLEHDITFESLLDIINEIVESELKK